MGNPLLDFSGLPHFDLILPEHVTSAIDTLLSECREVVSRLEKEKGELVWENFISPLDNATEKLGRAWGAVRHLNSVVDTPELRAAYNENLPKVTEFWTDLSQNLILFEQYKKIRSQKSFEKYSPARKKIIENTLRDFRLGGAELPSPKKERFAEIQKEQAAVSTKFSENVLDAVNNYSGYVSDIEELKGLPEDVINSAKAAAQAEGKDGYKFTLQFPSFYPVLQFADNRDLREKLYRANATKASELGENKDWDNTENINRLLKLRAEEAALLGYANFAEVSLVPKMAETPEQVMEFLEDLALRARPYAEKDLSELKEFAKEELGIASLEAWDMAYASEKLREARYAFSEQEVKQYFPEDKVIAGLFSLVEKIFSIRVLPDTAPVWHEDVKFYRIERDGKLLGQFYTDLYARNGKRSGAWMDDTRGRKVENGKVQTPVAYLICNFTKPFEENGVRQPSLLRHDEIITLFHEFGHCLNHLLTQVDELAVSGISGVEWDAVELPSQFMENFCWEREVIAPMSSHIKTGERIPRELFDKMLAAKNFQSGMQMLRQIEFAMTDMRLHYDYNPTGKQAFSEVLDEVRKRYSVVIPPSFNRFLHAFSHIFAGGYAAGYYSYKWAEVLSADAFSAFEEVKEKGGGLLSAEVGARFVSEILSVGGVRKALESFVAFRGRNPQIDALLRHNGMV